MQPLLESIRLAAPELVLATGAMVLLMIGVFRGDRSLVPLSWVSVGLYAFAGLTLLDDPATPRTAFDGLYIVDGLSTFLKAIMYAAAAASALLAEPHLKRARSARVE